MDPTRQDIRFMEMKDAINQLNNKVESLTKSFEETKAREAEKDQTIESLKALDAEKDQTIANLKEQIEYLTKKLFGKKSEKSDDVPGQLDLFNEAEEEYTHSVPEQVELPEDEDRRESADSKSRKKKQSNQEKYKNCRQTKEYLDIDEDQRICPVCGAELKCIGEEFVRQEIHVVPGYVKVINFYSKNYGCPACKKSGTGIPCIVKGKDGKPHMMKGMASASTVAWIMYQKYCNSNPLYRQEKDWERLYGIKITRATFASWLIENAEEFFKPVYSHMHRLLLARQFLMGDETPLQVLHEPDRKPQTKSFMWVFRTGEDGGVPIILYNYTETRAGYNAADFLGDYSGYMLSAAAALHMSGGTCWMRSPRGERMIIPSRQCRATCISKSSSLSKRGSGRNIKVPMRSEMPVSRRNVLYWMLSLRGLTGRSLSRDPVSIKQSFTSGTESRIF